MNGARRICLGAFAGAHGVRGEAKVKAFTQSEHGVADYGPVESEDGGRRFTLKFIRRLKPGLALVSAPEIRSREDAAALAGTRFFVDRAALPDAGDDEFYIEDLVGLDAEDDRNAPIGRIIAVHNFGAGDVLELEAASGRQGGLLVPFTRAAVPCIDIGARRVVIARAALDEIETGEGAPAAP